MKQDSNNNQAVCFECLHTPGAVVRTSDIPQVSHAANKFRVLTFHQRVDYEDLPVKTKLRGLSPRADYTDRAAAAGRRS